jgi:hypothetical protein
MKLIGKIALFLLLFVPVLLLISFKLPQLDFNSVYDETVL